MEKEFIKQVREVVERETGVSITEQTNKRDVVYARAIYFKLCRQLTHLTLQEIGDSVGRHHASVLHAINDVWPEVMAYNIEFADMYHKIAEDELMCPCEERYANLKKDYYELLGKGYKGEIRKTLTNL